MNPIRFHLSRISLLLLSATTLSLTWGTTSPLAAGTDIHLDKPYFRSYLEVTGQTFTAPLRWKKNEWLTATAVCGTTVFLYFDDTRIKNVMQEKRNGTTDNLADIGNNFGNGWVMVPALIAATGMGYLTKNKALRSSSLEAFESAALSGLFVQLIKFTGQRHRPNTGDSYNTWDGLSLKAKNQSFPSGHTGLAFSIASAYAEYYERWYVSIPAYACAALTGFARINDNKHWASDVFFGACIGILTAKAVHHRHLVNTTTPLGFTPVIDGRGISLEWDWKISTL
jgi:hypothetical protein